MRCYIDVWVGKDFELINDSNADQVEKLYVYHLQGGLGTKSSSNTIYTAISSVAWERPIFNTGHEFKGIENRRFFKIITGDSDMFDLVVEPGLSTERIVGTASGNIIERRHSIQ